MVSASKSFDIFPTLSEYLLSGSELAPASREILELFRRPVTKTLDCNAVVCTTTPGTRIGTASGHSFPLLILDGWAYQQIRFPDDRRVILDFFLPGDVLGTDPQAADMAGAQFFALTAVTSVELFALAAGDEILQKRAETTVASSRIRSLAALYQRALLLGRGSLHEKLRCTLMRIRERLGQPTDLPLRMPITNDQLADAVGASTGYVSHMMQQFHREGLLDSVAFDAQVDLSPHDADLQLDSDNRPARK